MSEKILTIDDLARFDIRIAIQAGLIKGLSSRIINFRRDGVANSVLESIQPNGTRYLFPIGDQTIEIVSSSANDDGNPVGTGARTVDVTLLNSYNLQPPETVTLNGQTPVALSTSGNRHLFSEVKTAGTIGRNEGNIYIFYNSAVVGGVPQTPANILAIIPIRSFGGVNIGRGNSLQAGHTIPNGEQYFLDSMVEQNKDTNNMTGASKRDQKYEQVLEFSDRSIVDFAVKRGLDSFGSNTSKVNILKQLFPTLSPKTDFELLGRAFDDDMDIILTASVFVLDVLSNNLGNIPSDI